MIWFGTAGDSLEVTSTQGSVYTNLGQQTDSLHNVVQYFRARLQDDGVVAISTNMDVNDGDNVPYTLRIERVGPKPGAALRQTCEQAKLTVTSSRLADHFSIVPVSIAHSIHDLSKWTTFTGIYNVALVSDSLYRLCQVPCVTPDTIKLLPGASVTGTASRERGQGDTKLRAPRPRLHVDQRIVPVDESAHDVETESRALSHGLRREKRIEHSTLELRGNAGAVVRHAHDDPRPLRAPTQ